MPYREQKVEKLYYSIGEAAEILNVPVSTVRFWENEFEMLKPKRNRKGNRMFTPVDMTTLKNIHFLLREKGMTLEGARRSIAAGGTETDPVLDVTSRLKDIRAMLLELIAEVK
ncbi:MAG: MerR family transcriptional regulator [Bacteroidetes bacterium]|nr:MerR family transcriptional regulator [Bacteroidota bacterium]